MGEWIRHDGRLTISEASGRLGCLYIPFAVAGLVMCAVAGYFLIDLIRSDEFMRVAPAIVRGEDFFSEDFGFRFFFAAVATLMGLTFFMGGLSYPMLRHGSEFTLDANERTVRFKKDGEGAYTFSFAEFSHIRLTRKQKQRRSGKYYVYRLALKKTDGGALWIHSSYDSSEMKQRATELYRLTGIKLKDKAKLGTSGPARSLPQATGDPFRIVQAHTPSLQIRQVGPEMLICEKKSFSLKRLILTHGVLLPVSILFCGLPLLILFVQNRKYELALDTNQLRLRGRLLVPGLAGELVVAWEDVQSVRLERVEPGDFRLSVYVPSAIELSAWQRFCFNADKFKRAKASPDGFLIGLFEVPLYGSRLSVRDLLFLQQLIKRKLRARTA